MPDIRGNWKCVATRATDMQGNPASPPFGPHPMGLVHFGPERMMSVVGDNRPAMPEGAPRLFQSYGGRYSFDGTTLVTRVDFASEASRVGGEQVRTVRFEGELMVLCPPPRLVEGQMVRQELFWQRMA